MAVNRRSTAGKWTIPARAALFILPLLALASRAGSAGESWGDETSKLTSGAEYAKSKAICRRLKNLEPPAADRPTPSQARGLNGCDSEKLYYGEGVKPDYVKARFCALAEADGADDEVFGGSAILMQIYANGLGVRRDPDLATTYACQIDGAPAESDGRVRHMQSLKTKPEHVDYCDDITSGLAGGYCEARASSQAAVGRDAHLKALVGGLPPSARTAYATMKTAFDAFVDAHGGGEVDLSGTARGAIEIQEEDSIRNQLVKDLTRLLTSRWPPAAPGDAAAADLALNARYRQALAWSVGKDNASTIKPEGVRTAQRAWLTYRDTFTRFASAAAPSTSQAAVVARLTKLRIAQLEELTS